MSPGGEVPEGVPELPPGGGENQENSGPPKMVDLLLLERPFELKTGPGPPRAHLGLPAGGGLGPLGDG